MRDVPTLPACDGKTPLRHEFAGGWRLLVAMHVTIAFGVAVMLPFSMSVFTSSLGNEFHWSRQQIGTSISIMAAGVIPASLLVGTLIDRYGVRTIILASQVGLAGCYLAFSAMTALWHFYLINMLLPILGAGTLLITATKSINSRFCDHRGLALGIALAGSGVGGFIVPLVAASAIETFGWRTAFAILAMLPLSAAMLVLLWVKKDQADPQGGSGRGGDSQEGIAFREALTGYRFWLIAAAFLCASGAYVGVVGNLAPMAGEAGLLPLAAAGMMSLFAMAMLAGRLITGLLLDRLWAPLVAVLLCGPAGVALFLWGQGYTDALYLQVFLIGLASGSEYDLSAYVISKYFGSCNYGKIYACIYAFFAVGGVAFSQFYGWSYELSGSYVRGILVSAIGFSMCWMLLLPLGRYPSNPTAR